MPTRALAIPADLAVNQPIIQRPPVAADAFGLQTTLQAGFALIEFEHQLHPHHVLSGFQLNWQKRVWAARVNELAARGRNQLLIVSQQELDWRMGRPLRDMIAAETNARYRTQLEITAQVAIAQHRRMVEIDTNASVTLIRERSQARLNELEAAARLTQRSPDQEAQQRMAAADVFWKQINQVRLNAALTEDDKDLQIEALLKAVAQFLGGHA